MIDVCQLCGRHITEHGSGEGFPCPDGPWWKNDGTGFFTRDPLADDEEADE